MKKQIKMMMLVGMMLATTTTGAYANQELNQMKMNHMQVMQELMANPEKGAAKFCKEQRGNPVYAPSYGMMCNPDGTVKPKNVESPEVKRLAVIFPGAAKAIKSSDSLKDYIEGVQFKASEREKLGLEPYPSDYELKFYQKNTLDDALGTWSGRGANKSVYQTFIDAENSLKSGTISNSEFEQIKANLLKRSEELGKLNDKVMALTKVPILNSTMGISNSEVGAGPNKVNDAMNNVRMIRGIIGK